MDNDLQRLREAALGEIQQANSKIALENLRVKFLGKAGAISRLSENMRNVPKEDRPRIGKLLNEIRNAVTAALDGRLDALESEGEAQNLSDVDETLPGTPFRVGGLHPLTLLQERAVQILRRLGFALADGPDIETEWHCFDALNTPANHPARNDSDTFYLPDGRLLRTHTSTVQIRTMVARQPPVRVIGPGAAYRRDETDATHLNQFNQLEGLYVDRQRQRRRPQRNFGIFCSGVVRSRGADPAATTFLSVSRSQVLNLISDCPGSRVANGWNSWGVEWSIPPCSKQSTLKRGDSAYDPEDWTGFAFGMGLERLAMSLFGLPDIRLLIENDQRFLAQFAT